MNPKKFFLSLITTLAALLMGTSQSVEAQCSAKVDLGAAYVHLDNLTSGVTTHSADLAAIRADVNFKLFEGLIVKPTALYGASNPFHVQSDDSLFAAAITVGHCFPITEKILVQPNVGYTYTKMKTVFSGVVTNFIPPCGPTEIHFHGLKQSFTSNGPSLGLEGYYFFTKRFRLCLAVQYIWSKTDAEVHGIYNDKSHTKGPSYSGMLEWDINDCWSVNVAGAYNISLTKEKHGLRAAGAKVGIARWF
jgi:hypothetical protein